MPKSPIPDRFEGLRAVSAAEMAAIDRASERSGVPPLELMENAGRAVAEQAADYLMMRLGKPIESSRVVVCCGRGNNGGDGLVAARHLKAKGCAVSVFIVPSREPGYGSEVKANLRKAAEAGVPVRELGKEGDWLERGLAEADLAVDALLGTGSSGKPAGVVREAIQGMMRSGKPIIAVDIPSGLNPDSGHHSGVFVRAARTLALGLPKKGLLAPHAAQNVGELKVLDIGIPKQVLEEKK